MSHFTYCSNYTLIHFAHEMTILQICGLLGYYAGLIHCPETSVNNYHMPPHNTPEDPRFYQHRGGSLKSRQFFKLTFPHY
jgi:hypothetical protein